jgi:hypothetical protein
MRRFAAMLGLLALLMSGCTGNDEEPQATEATETAEGTPEDGADEQAEVPEAADLSVPNELAADAEGPGTAHAYPEPIVYAVEGLTFEVQAIRLIAREDVAALAPEYDEHVREGVRTIAVLRVRAENASGGPLGFYPDQAVMEAGNRAEAAPRLSDDVGGQMEDGTVHEGNLVWLLRESVDSAVGAELRLRVDAPFDLETFQPIAEPGILELSF